MVVCDIHFLQMLNAIFPQNVILNHKFLDFNSGRPLFHILQNKVTNYQRFITFCVKERSCFPHVILSAPFNLDTMMKVKGVNRDVNNQAIYQPNWDLKI